MCDYSNDDHYGESEYRSDLHTSASDLSRGYPNSLTDYVEQWYYGNLVTRFEQYSHDDLYVYPNRGSVCDYSNDDHYGESEYRSDVHTSTSDLSRSYPYSLTDHIEQWYYGNLVTRFEQYGHDDLYVYPNRGTMCHFSNDDHYGESEYRSDVYASASDLSRGYINCLTDYVEQWYYGNMVTCFKQYDDYNVYIYTKFKFEL